MARTLDEIIRELDAGYNPQRQLINDRLTALPGQADAEIAGLGAQAQQAYGDITAQAQARGMGFSGIPLAEQAKFNATNFMPAVARVRQSQNDVKSSLLEALNASTIDQRNRAMSIRQTELDRDEAARQFNEKLAAEKEAQAQAMRAAARGGGGGGGGGFSFGSLGGGGMTAAPKPQMIKKSGGSGFAFTDAGGNSISAAKYAQLTGQTIDRVLMAMGQNGDAYAANAYNWLQRVKGMDFVNTPQKLMTAAQKNFAPLFWGA